MEAFALIGLFVDNQDLEQLKIYENVLIQEEVLPKTSCDHLDIQDYFSKLTRSCPTCNMPISLIKGSYATYKKGLVGYKPGFFDNTTLDLRDRCKHTKGKHCSKLKFCIKCSKFCNSCTCPKGCLYVIDICNPKIYHNVDKMCNCYGYQYFKDCDCNFIDYDVSLDEVKGIDIFNNKEEYKLTWDDEEGFIILCDSFIISNKNNVINVKKKYVKLKKDIKKLAQKFGIKNGEFEIRIKFIKN